MEKNTKDIQLIINDRHNLLQILIKEPDTKIKIPIFLRGEMIFFPKIPIDSDNIFFKPEKLKELKIAFQRLQGIGSSYFKLVISDRELILSAKGHIDREETIIKIDLDNPIKHSYIGKFQLDYFVDLLGTLEVSEVDIKFKLDSALYIAFKKSVHYKNEQIIGYLILSQVITEDFEEEDDSIEEFTEDFEEE